VLVSLPDALVATTRFGLGARPSEHARIAADPRGWLLAQLTPAAPIPGLPSTSDALANARALRGAGKADRDAYRRANRALYEREAAARCARFATTDQPFVERLVTFWSNHFTVSVRRPLVAGLVGAFEREAIRPNVLGPFSALLDAVVHHPAMLLYLDNARSVAPDSPTGEKRDRGLNENLGREILELHTLGVDGGYTQEDVTALAEILTGWTVPTDVAGARADGFLFDERRHAPGAKTLLGRTWIADGEAEGVAVLRALAEHPSTARHVAGKLARHFSVDDPAPLARVFAETTGDLAAVARALVASQAAWAPAPRKLKSPQDLVISTARALGIADGEALLAGLVRLGQAPWSAPSPAGWPDDDASWAGPQAILDRVDQAEQVGGRVGARFPDVLAHAEDLLGPRLDAPTRARIAAARDAAYALALLLASPAFQRR
jgi:uncharacterized protein (DUF1800 family)